MSFGVECMDDWEAASKLSSMCLFTIKYAALCHMYDKHTHTHTTYSRIECRKLQSTATSLAYSFAVCTISRPLLSGAYLNRLAWHGAYLCVHMNTPLRNALVYWVLVNKTVCCSRCSVVVSFHSVVVLLHIYVCIGCAKETGCICCGIDGIDCV